jgi:hypothetical protein
VARVDFEKEVAACVNTRRQNFAFLLYSSLEEWTMQNVLYVDINFH